MDRFLSDLRVRLQRHLLPGIMRVIRPFLTVQFVIFMLMGIISTVVSVGTATLLDVLMYHLLSTENMLRYIASHLRLNFIIGYIVSLIASFLLNSKFTFHQKPTFKNLVKFPISYIPNFAFQYLMVFVFTALNWNSTAAYICAAVFGTPVTFIAMKVIIFKRKKSV